MDLKEFGTKLVKLAPAIGGAFLGPVGIAGGTLLGVLANAFGLKDDAEPDEVLQAIQTDPDAMLKLKALELEHEGLIARLNQERVLAEMKTDLENVKSARERETRITEVTGKKETTLYVLAWLIVAGFFGSLIFLIVNGLPEGPGKDAVLLLLGALVASYRDVGNYFFGSSKGSADKTRIMANQVDK